MRLPLCLLIILFSHANAIAKQNQSFVPENDTVVALWSKNKTTPQLNEESIAHLLDQAKYVGNSQHYARAKSLLSQASESTLPKHQRLYYNALIKQHYHEFEDSLILLKKVLDTKPQHINVLLLSANLYAVQGHFELAKKTCASLTGLVEAILVAACKLNIDAQEGTNTQIQNALDSLTEFSQKFPSKSQETTIYVAEIQASMASYLGQNAFANQILAPHLNRELPLSFWVLWSNIQIDLGQSDKVLSILGPLVEKTQNKDDALLLRLAIAEELSSSASPTKLLPLVTERIALRMLRQDQEHAFDIALYYIHLEEQAAEAYRWALVNWQQAKLQEDRKLLTTTQQMMNGTAQ